MKKITLIVFALAVGAGIWVWYVDREPVSVYPESHRSATYMIDGSAVTLVNGMAESEAVPGAATKTITRYFGNEAYGDVNADGVSDIAFLLSQDRGGSGTFYYVAAALKMGNGYKGTNGVLLGDRVAPQPTEILQDGEIIVNYAERIPGEPMTARPSVGVSKYLRVVNDQLVEIQK